MRPIAILLLVAAAVAAEDPFVAALERFERVVAKAAKPDAQAAVDSAIEALVATGDVRAVKPLLSFLVTTFQLEEGLRKADREARQREADAVERIKTLDTEIGFLHLKEKAGDTTVGPEIRKRIEEHGRQMRATDEARAEAARLRRYIGFVRGLREKLANGGAQVLKGLAGDQVAAGLDGARQVLDPANREQALFLVRVLRGSGSKQAESYLLEVFAQPKIDDAVLRAVPYAIAPVMTRRGADALLEAWARDPDGRGKHARHALSLAAHRNLADLEAARAWAKSLGG